MNDTLLVALIGAAGVVVAALLAFAVAWVDRRSKSRTAEAATLAAQASVLVADAAKTAAGAASEEAQAEMRKAVVAEREQASADWARFCEANDRTIKTLFGQVASNSRRINDAEMRAEAADLRAAQSQKLYAVAIIYLRRLVDWINENLPGESYPPPPAELTVDL